MERLLRRREFLAAAKAPAVSTPGLVVQGLKRGDAGPPRVGFTCTKKLGNAVARNRIRRRIKEAARLTLPGLAKPSYDYVLIGRGAAETRGFEELRKDIISAVTRLHAGQAPSRNRDKQK
jgi:ribonuclease P protein component